TSIIDCSFRLGAKLADFSECQRVISEKQYCRGVFKQVAVTGSTGNANWQSECSSFTVVGLVEESMTAQLALGCSFACVAGNDFRPTAQSQRREVEILTVSSNYHYV